MIEDILCQVGLSDNEAKIYLALLEMHKSSATVLGNRVKIHRNVARNTCQQLVKRGLALEKKDGNTFVYYSESPEKLSYLLKEEEQEAQKKREQLNRVLGTLKGIVNPNMVLPKVRFFEGKKGYIKFCEESLNCKDGEIIFITSIEKFQEIITQQYDSEYFIPTRVSKGINLKLLCPKTALTVKMKDEDAKELRETRFLPGHFPIDNTVFIFDDKITLISNEAVPSCVMITSDEITKTIKALFAFMWECAET